jgi:hypothetical protein
MLPYIPVNRRLLQVHFQDSATLLLFQIDTALLSLFPRQVSGFMPHRKHDMDGRSQGLSIDTVLFAGAAVNASPNRIDLSPCT